MAKLTKHEAELHLRACELVASDRRLTSEEREFVLTHWQESSSSTQIRDNAFFTPLGLARDLALHVYGDRVIDLGAGIGRLAYGCQDPARGWNGGPPRELVCVERNPQFVEVGRRVLPQADWICADMFALPSDLGSFDTAISNPPFGTAARSRRAPRYSGPYSVYEVIDLAADLARHGAFIIPQQRAPFRYSGNRHYEPVPDPGYLRFEETTGITLEANCGIDTAYYTSDWRDVAPLVEVVTCDFSERRSPTSPRRMARGRASGWQQDTLLGGDPEGS